MSSSNNITTCARSTPLSRAQVEEILAELRTHHPLISFDSIWTETTGDLDQLTSLRAMEKTDFFTREIEALQLRGDCRISIHSAKDLPESLSSGLVIIALTRGVDSSDVIVMRENGPLAQGARIGTSSLRRENNVRTARADLICADIRGSILARLEQLDRGDYDGVVMAEAALIRLGLTHRHRIPLPGERSPLQGQLAVVARAEDLEMRELFACIDVRKS